MAGIGPINGVRPPMQATGASRADQAPAGEKHDGQFGKVLKTYVDNVDDKQQASYEAIRDLVAGKSNDVMPVVSAVAKADMSFKLLMGVRNKVIEAYKQTMNMQV